MDRTVSGRVRTLVAWYTPTDSNAFDGVLASDTEAEIGSDMSDRTEAF